MKAISAAIVFLGSVGLFASHTLLGEAYHWMVVGLASCLAFVSLLAWFLEMVRDR